MRVQGSWALDSMVLDRDFSRDHSTVISKKNHWVHNGVSLSMYMYINSIEHYQKICYLVEQCHGIASPRGHYFSAVLTHCGKLPKETSPRVLT